MDAIVRKRDPNEDSENKDENSDTSSSYPIFPMTVADDKDRKL